MTSQSIDLSPFREPGSLHVHIDCSAQRDLYDEFEHWLHSERRVVRPNTISKSVKGPQSKQAWLEETLSGHFQKTLLDSTPDATEPEYFLTTGVANRAEALSLVKEILHRAVDHSEVIVEVENVAATYEGMETWKPWPITQLVPDISEAEAGYKRSKTVRFEFHHGFDIRKEVADTKDPTFTLEQLRDETKDFLNFATWSLFENPHYWSYRSTAFSAEQLRELDVKIRQTCESEYRLLEHYLLAEKKLPIRNLRTVVEKIVGVWKSPIVAYVPNSVTIEALVGAPNERVPNFADVFQQQSIKAVGQFDQTAHTEIKGHLEPFRSILDKSGYQASLIELAIIEELHSPARESDDDKAPEREFRSLVASYYDEPKSRLPVLLDAWDKAIHNVVGVERPQPIVSHPDTYQSGYLFASMNWLVQDAWRCCFPNSPRWSVRTPDQWLKTVEPVDGAIESQLEGLSGKELQRFDEPATYRRPYDFRWVRRYESVDKTVSMLAAGFIKTLLDQLNTSDGEQKEKLLRILVTLSHSLLLIVPFLRPVEPDSSEPAPQLGEKAEREAGGCLFVVIEPKSATYAVEMIEQMNHVALRLSWMLSRAALREAYTQRGSIRREAVDAVITDKEDPTHPNDCFDVFFAHNSADKPAVVVIAKRLRECGIQVWLDKEQIPPGRWFLDVIEKAIPKAKSAAIFVGLSGIGKVQIVELRTIFNRCFYEKIPVIPVLLPGVIDLPEDLLFLRGLQFVRFSSLDDAEALKNLVWGIREP